MAPLLKDAPRSKLGRFAQLVGRRPTKASSCSFETEFNSAVQPQLPQGEHEASTQSAWQSSAHSIEVLSERHILHQVPGLANGSVAKSLQRCSGAILQLA